MFSSETQKGCGSGWEGRWEDMGRIGGGRTVIGIYCMGEKKSIFNKKRKECKSIQVSTLIKSLIHTKKYMEICYSNKRILS